MLADDSVTAQNMGRKILADAGYEVITVNNGSAALKKISEQHPDLIVLDVYMPGYSGLEVCQRIKDVPDTSRIPILLTVGKLEPFKPEEARRARADGFIVKPFEASELLSALSKLEDKVVPRSESSKTGRFARASAAIEDSRFDKSMAVEEDSGWKSRIVFPKKKSKPAEEEVEDPATYTPVHKDNRLATEPTPVEKAPAPEPVEEKHVDLGALATAGLPKDVTPEEIAALAAAAAQVKGKLSEEKAPEPAAQEMPVVAPAEVETPKPEINAEAPVAEPLPAPAPLPDVPAPAAPAATFAEQSIEKVETKEPEPQVVPSAAAVMAAIASLETEAVETPASSSGNDASAPSAPQTADEPVTMAVAAPVPTNAERVGSRWTAVTVALAPEDAGISLEQEMQKAYAASAAVGGSVSTVTLPASEVAPAPVVESPAEAVPPSVAVEGSTHASASVNTPAEVAPEAAETMSAVANAATDAISAAVAHLESVAAAYVAEKAAAVAQVPAPEAPEEQATSPQPAAPERIESASEISESKTLETKAEELPVAEAVAPEEPAKVEAPHSEEAVAPARAEALKTEEPKAVSEEPAREESKEEVPVVDAPVAEPPVESSAEVEQHASADTVSEEPAVPTREAFRAGGSDDMAKRESETAAAWASWRKIRETGHAKPVAEAADESEESSSSSKDAAMAVAAGAEHNPEDTKSLDADPEIASIVDSVLADMRPKIVEEIARKLGKKK